jgi:glycolate dehydrogenase iron-sulfur subunit
MKQVADGAADVDATLADHLYVCLGCRACETACPSGVPFGQLLEWGRSEVERRGEIDESRRGWRWLRRFAFEWLLPNRAAFGFAMAPVRLLRENPALAGLLRAMPMPSAMRRMLAMIPPAGRVPSRPLPREIAAEGQRRARVGLFTGCVMGAVFPDVHAAFVRVLPDRQWCCGALNLHAGDPEHAKAMARRNIDAFESAGVDAVVLDSAGCGAAMKEYAQLLRDDPAYALRAAKFGAKVKDAAEFLYSLGPRADFGPIHRRITYQDACHLAHGQGVRAEPRALLSMIPGIELVEMAFADRCCGAAGVYSITHPQMSERILDEKMAFIEATGAQMVVVANPGCHMQLFAGSARGRSPVSVRHLVELLDEAYASKNVVG